MLAGARSCFLLSSLLTLLFAASTRALPQINGVPASVTSLGFGGHFTPGPRASVTSLGPNSYGNSWPVFGGWGVNLFLAQNPGLPLVSGHHHRRRENHDYFPIGMIEPVYVPVPYSVDAVDDSPENTDSVRASSHRAPTPPDKRAVDPDPDPKFAFSMPAPLEPEEPVAEQPSTVLAFKDGHESDVLNYAIVGDTLFDFGSGRTLKILLADLDLPSTRKLNDHRGVDFQIPLSLAKQ
jgi:hypothetical protein